MIGDWLVQNLGHRRSLYRDLSERSSPLKICIFLIILVPDIYQHVLLLLKCASFRSTMSMGERNTSQLYFKKRSCQKIKVLNKGSHYIRVGQGTVPEIAWNFTFEKWFMACLKVWRSVPQIGTVLYSPIKTTYSNQIWISYQQPPSQTLAIFEHTVTS